MESTSKQRKDAAEEWEFEDPTGPMMHGEGDRSEEDRQWMSDWFLARKTEREKEGANSTKEAK